ncbi:hypothetical protein AVHM3334_09280 [Acidovorax sp. SUPP3334]|nr:hypothetical protein AVHM3334_09280 [Acidovorax sp. SUPP3334]
MGLDYLSGAANFDPAVDSVTDDFASRLVWFDTLVGNVDRTARNTNLLVWHRRPWLIDHGAALTFHHAWSGTVAVPAKPFAPIADHVLLPRATALASVDAELAGRLTPEVLQGILAEVPDEFLELAGADHAEGPLTAPATHRQAYADYFAARLAGRQTWLQGAIDARG